jgi:16S rRNA (uracil1498-N3)-methyltransferase
MSGLRCFYHHSGQKLSKHISLNAAESHHLVKVRRARINDTVSVFDGRGNEWECQLHLANVKKAVLKVRAHHIAALSPDSITLAQGLPKGKTMDTIVQKAVELGVQKIVPLITENSEVRVSKDRALEKVRKWNSVAIEACKQSGNSYLPEIDPIMSVNSFCEALPEKALKYIASLSTQAVSLRQALREQRNQKKSLSQSVIILIGPEGDYTPEEHDLACENGFIPITLGKRVLRSDTAAIVALALLNYELRNEA